MEMHERIKYLRKKNNLTLQQVADKVGVGPSTVRKWEVGMISNMKRDKIQSLASALHTTPEYLMGWEDESTEELKATLTAEFSSLDDDKRKQVIDYIHFLASQK